MHRAEVAVGFRGVVTAVAMGGAGKWGSLMVQACRNLNF